MSSRFPPDRKLPRRTMRRYESLPLLDLVERMLFGRSRAAWDVFHERPVCCDPLGNCRRLSDALLAASRTFWAVSIAGSTWAAEQAYDDALDHFLYTPASCGRRRTGAMSRRYLRAFLRSARRLIQQMPGGSPAEQDAWTMLLMHKWMLRALRRACREARRMADGARSRYAWPVNGGCITVRLPRDHAGHGRRDWLKRHVSDCDPARLGETQRVQAIIDQYLGRRAIVPLDSCLAAGPTAHPDDSPSEALARKELFARNLQQFVAKEKSASLALQRPAVRRLGAEGVHRLVLLLFAARVDGDAAALAAAKRMTSASTLSRFAGPNWKPTDDKDPPDLWLNLGHITATHEIFREAAQAAGVWPKLAEIAACNTRPRLRGYRHE